MFAVIFEVQPKKERWNDYLDLAKYLKPKLEAIDGFIDNERFGSKRTKGRVLSLSTWRDEKAVVRWRTEREHFIEFLRKQAGRDVGSAARREADGRCALAASDRLVPKRSATQPGAQRSRPDAENFGGEISFLNLPHIIRSPRRRGRAGSGARQDRVSWRSGR